MGKLVLGRNKSAGSSPVILQPIVVNPIGIIEYDVDSNGVITGYSKPIDLKGITRISGERVFYYLFYYTNADLHDLIINGSDVTQIDGVGAFNYTFYKGSSYNFRFIKGPLTCLPNLTSIYRTGSSDVFSAIGNDSMVYDYAANLQTVGNTASGNYSTFSWYNNSQNTNLRFLGFPNLTTLNPFSGTSSSLSITGSNQSNVKIMINQSIQSQITSYMGSGVNTQIIPVSGGKELPLVFSDENLEAWLFDCPLHYDKKFVFGYGIFHHILVKTPLNTIPGIAYDYSVSVDSTTQSVEIPSSQSQTLYKVTFTIPSTVPAGAISIPTAQVRTLPLYGWCDETKPLSLDSTYSFYTTGGISCKIDVIYNQSGYLVRQTDFEIPALSSDYVITLDVAQTQDTILNYENVINGDFGGDTSHTGVTAGNLIQLWSQVATAESYAVWYKIPATSASETFILSGESYASTESNWDFGYIAVSTNPDYRPSGTEIKNNTYSYGSIIVKQSGTSVSSPVEFSSSTVFDRSVDRYIMIGYASDSSGRTGDDSFYVNYIKITFS